MGALLGVKQAGYQRWEDDPDKPAAYAALEKAKIIYQERTGHPWRTASSILMEKEAGGAGFLGATPTDQMADHADLEKVKGRPPLAFRPFPAHAPTETDSWAAMQIVENALRERRLFDQAKPEQKKYLADNLARGMASGETLESLQNGLRVALDLVEAAYRKFDE